MVISPKADKTKQRILNAAAKLFREKGYASVSIRTIAKMANMKAGSVYYHFASKEVIVIEVLNIGIQKVLEHVETAISHLPEKALPSQRIHTGIYAHLTALFEFSDYTSANVRIFGQVPENAQKENLEIRRQYEGLWDQILRSANLTKVNQNDIDLKTIRLLLIGSLNATLEWFNPEGGDVSKLARDYADMLLHGILDKTEDKG